MSNDLRELDAALQQFDHQLRSAFCELDVVNALSQLLDKIHANGRQAPDELLYERSAFAFYGDYRGRDSNWETYYGPLMVCKDESGQLVESPDIKSLTEGTLRYWGERARVAKHPLLRCRYSDLCWDLTKKVSGHKPSVELAKIVIDTTIEAADSLLFVSAVKGQKKLGRALSIALATKDSERIAAIRDAIVKYEDRMASSVLAGHWGLSFDLILENRKIPVTPEIEAKIIADLEADLGRSVSEVGEETADPFLGECAAIRLASYYRRGQNLDGLKRVLRAYGDNLMRCSERSSAMLAGGWLRILHGLYTRFGMRDEAGAILTRLREVGKRSLQEMASFSDKIEIPRERWEKYIQHMTTGTLSDCLHRVALQFLPNRDTVEKQIKELAKSNPLSAMFGITPVDADGRPLAEIGSVERDLDGRVVHQIAQNMISGEILLRNTLDEIREKFRPGVQEILDHLYSAPVFSTEQEPFLRQGLEDYLTGRLLPSVHVLIPQIEVTMRHILERIGGVLWKPGREDGFVLRNLDDLLRDPLILQHVPRANVDYFKVLFVDRRGWNLRHNVCHGLVRAEEFNRVTADRCMHALLVLALLREQTTGAQRAGE